jgi:hypothetical protein
MNQVKRIFGKSLIISKSEYEIPHSGNQKNSEGGFCKISN